MKYEDVFFWVQYVLENLSQLAEMRSNYIWLHNEEQSRKKTQQYKIQVMFLITVYVRKISWLVQCVAHTGRKMWLQKINYKKLFQQNIK